ncbi:MAG TPA: tetratricopeptide repeat protein [Verrucomicrobiae bacterium]|jgi:tetratricopeptide (TPR) repeat protein|nr:tetratricopeptide repeat protein [Verrucomicrobiae bacterium]
MKRLVTVAMVVTFLAAPALASGAPDAPVSSASPSVADLIAQAQKFVRSKDLQSALKAAQQAVALGPNSAEAVVELGDIEDDLGDHVDAIIDYNKGITLNPDYAYAYETKCGTEIDLGKDTEAIADCTKAIGLDPKDEDAYRFRAEGKDDLGDQAGGLTDIDQALTIDATYISAYNVKCGILRDMGRYAESLAACNRSLALDPTADYALYVRGRTYLAQAQFDLAYADLSKFVAGEPDDEFGKIALARAQYGRGHAGDYDAALANVNAYIARHDSIDTAYLLRAQIDLKLGKTDDAKADATSALRYARIGNDTDVATTAQSVLDSIATKP